MAIILSFLFAISAALYGIYRLHDMELKKLQFQEDLGIEVEKIEFIRQCRNKLFIAMIITTLAVINIGYTYIHYVR